jgi:hypothetical protein
VKLALKLTFNRAGDNLPSTWIHESTSARANEAAAIKPSGIILSSQGSPEPPGAQNTIASISASDTGSDK